MPKIKQLFRPIKVTSSRLNWFPGHMYKGLKDIFAKLNTVDCVLEVHDARIPFSGRNEEFRNQVVPIKPTFLIMNKRDLADLTNWDTIKSKLLSQGYSDVVLTNLSGDQYAHEERGYLNLAQTISDTIRLSDRYNRINSIHKRIMIVGIPNVGKSTLINRLRQHHLGLSGTPAEVGPQAGVTKHVHQNIKICANPPMYVIDTPGILHPSALKSQEEAHKISLCSSLTDKIVDVVELAEYLLEYLNSHNMTSYTIDFGMEKPANCLAELVGYGAIRFDKMIRLKNTDNKESFTPDVNAICWQFIKLFRKGNLGKVMLDNIE